MAFPHTPGLSQNNPHDINHGGSPTCFHKGSWLSGSWSSCLHPGPHLQSAVLQRMSIQNTILVYHPAATFHQHNPPPQSPHFQPVYLIRKVNSTYFTPISLLPPFHSCRQYPTLSQPTSLLNRDLNHDFSVVQNSFTSPTGSHPWKGDDGILPSHSRIISGAIHKGENILLLRGIEPGLPRWDLATTTTMIPDTDKLNV